jgi:hypothetical protein
MTLGEFLGASFPVLAKPGEEQRRQLKTSNLESANR